MPSLIPGYEYDIFISYRQKDNKGDRWVSEFVEALKTELESTFKEEISVYFDINPHDGLLETHDVDASLKEKLKCLVFIPIISRTYCDPKSFAWEHEYKAFIEQAVADRFGLKIKLTGGNVACRVLPVRIHDLDPEDISLCASVLGTHLRSVDFIYKEPGVNRPLTPNDNEDKNLNKTNYRNQINKVALAVKEIITSLNQAEQITDEQKGELFRLSSTPVKRYRSPMITISIIILALFIIGLLLIPKLKGSEEQVEKSIAVLPFKLLSDEPDKQYLADGVMEAILLHLSRIRDLRVLSSTSVEQYRQTAKTIETIGRELNVEYVLEGKFQKHGDNVRLIVQLIRAGKESHIWANEYNREWNDIFMVQSEVAQSIANEIKVAVSPLAKMNIETAPTYNLTAYDFYLRGKDYLERSYMEADKRNARQMFERAVELDPDFGLAWAGMAASSRNLFWFYYDRSEENLELTKEYLNKALALSPGAKEVKMEEAAYYYQCKLDYSASLNILEKLQSDYPNDNGIYFSMSLIQRRMGEFRKSLENIEQAISLNPFQWTYWYEAGHTSRAMREYTKAEKYYKRVVDLNPSFSEIYTALLELYINTGQIDKADRFYIDNEKLISPQFRKYIQAGLLFYKRNFVEAVSIAQAMTEDAISFQHFYLTKNLLLGLFHRAIPDNAMAISHFEAEREFLLTKIKESAADHRFYRSLGIAYAGLGMEEEALAAGRKALEMLDLSKDAMGGIDPELDMVKILVMTGEHDEAMRRLEKIISQHGDLTANILKIDPFWDPVRNHEIFRKIIANPEYKGI